MFVRRTVEPSPAGPRPHLPCSRGSRRPRRSSPAVARRRSVGRILALVVGLWTGPATVGAPVEAATPAVATSMAVGFSLHPERVLVIVVDGLRPDYVTEAWMPRLNALAESGVRGLDHHAAYPTVTRVNSPAIFTGRTPGGNGAMGNNVYMPDVDASRELDAGDWRDLAVIDEATGGRLLTTPSLGELLDAAGLTYFAASSGSTGSGGLMNPRGAGAGMVHHAMTLPDTLRSVVDRVLGPVPEVPEGRPAIPLVARAVDALLEIGVDRADADVLAVWLTEPDGTAHDHGMGAPETVRALADVDAEIGRLLEGLDARGVLSEMSVLVVSDHGFSMRTGEQSLDDLLVEAGLKASNGSMDVVVANEAIHVMEGGEARRDSIVRLLQRTEWVGPVFTRDRDAVGRARGGPGVAAGTVGFRAVGWDHERSSDILISQDWSPAVNEWGFEGEVFRPGTAGHGTSSPWDIRAAFIAAGSGVRSGIDLTTPTGNIDVVPTVLHLMGVDPARLAATLPEWVETEDAGTPNISFDGRVLREILSEGPDPSAVTVRRDSIMAETAIPGGQYRMVVHQSWIDSTMYFDGTRVERGPRSPSGRAFREIRRFSSPHAHQGVAVDAEHVYAITNRAIGKHDKTTGALVDEWIGDEDGPIVHLNSGIVREGRLYAVHSNYPGVPMVSSVEVWDVETMEHVESHSLGIFQGSATWADRRDGEWWVGFANYEGRGGQPGRDSSWTTVVRFDDLWRPMGGYTFPPEVVERFADRSNSGGAWGPDGYLYATGHDHPEVYVLRPPDGGSVLELVEVVPITAEGQAFAWDPVEPRHLYTIIRSRNDIVVSEMEREP